MVKEYEPAQRRNNNRRDILYDRQMRHTVGGPKVVGRDVQLWNTKL
ncbi:hypothetical protein L798_02040 [Zootermopsis nevadensis]|uniref:Uncharacterized protein n=1 Tax=Zootermopsis nevadensis TaxID=136037 RepID=A0A067RG53_ZOONE|nr:hypothetical protein L798_02040 [Zootermopsis nevadensis]